MSKKQTRSTKGQQSLANDETVKTYLYQFENYEKPHKLAKGLIVKQ